MDDEEIFDERFSAAKSPLDDALIEQYCGNIEERIRTAKSRSNAEMIVNDACRGFEDQCGSEIIPIFLRRHVLELFQKYWGD